MGPVEIIIKAQTVSVQRLWRVVCIESLHSVSVRVAMNVTVNVTAVSSLGGLYSCLGAHY